MEEKRDLDIQATALGRSSQKLLAEAERPEKGLHLSQNEPYFNPQALILKEKALDKALQALKRAALGFSGGVDSSWLLYAAWRCGLEIHPFFVKTPFQPHFELEDAQKVAAFCGVKLEIIDFDVLNCPEVAANGPRRCYYCKKAIFSALNRRAKALSIEHLLDGSNASDIDSQRPGMRALKELQVLSPLRECGLLKVEVRALSRQVGLFTWNKPAYACLATRIPTNTAINVEDLQTVEWGEAQLASMGFKDFRLRWRPPGGALLQVCREQMDLALANRSIILEVLGTKYEQVYLDLKERACDEYCRT